MHMSLHKSRQNRAAARINHNVCGVRCFVNARNTIPANKQIALHDGIILIHHNERTVLY